MKIALYVLALPIFLLVTGCSDAPKPLTSGLVVSGTVWRHPLSSPSNTGEEIPHDARVEVYDRHILIHYADGSRQVALLDHVSDLRLK